jgi:hypothetical protein
VWDYTERESGASHPLLHNLWRDRRGSLMWAITAYYNPIRYKRRLANYRIFRQEPGHTASDRRAVF